MTTQQRLRRISRFYNRIGDNGWRESDYFTFSVRSPALRRWIATQLPAKMVKVLSIGCGTGELEGHLSELKHQVICIDLSRPMLKRAGDRGLKLLVQADSQSLPFGDESMDVVIFMESVGYIHMPTAFKEAARVLRNRGRLLITTYSGDVEVHAPYTKIGLNEVASSVAAAGFRMREHRFLNPKRNSVLEVTSNDQSTLLYILCTKRGSGHRVTELSR